MKIDPIIGSSEPRHNPQTAQPPSCNTGAQKPDLSISSSPEAFIDYFRVTFDATIYTLEDVQDLLGREGFTDLPYGRNGYTHGMIRGGVKIYFGGDGTHNKADHPTIHLDVSGEGCRQLEGCGIVGTSPDGYTWPQFLGHLRHWGRFTRLDTAVDDKAGLLDLDVIQTCWERDQVISRWKDLTDWKKSKNGQATSGRTLYFGNRQSRAFLRIYDKAAQLRSQGKPSADHHIRIELETKDERAHALAGAIEQKGFTAALGVITNYINFVEDDPSQRKSRRSLLDWWETFIQACEKISLSVAPEIWTIERVEKWMREQVAPCLAVIHDHWQIFKEPDGFNRFINLINEGRSRWKPKHKALLAPAPS